MSRARLGDLTVVHLSDGEPCAAPFWADLRAACPRARRTDGAAGLGAAARLAETARFIAVRAEARVDLVFFDLPLDDDGLGPTTVVRWPGRNAVNGLVEAGAIECWPRDLALTVRSSTAVGLGDGAAALRWSDGANRPEGPFRIEEPVAFARVHTDASPAWAFRAAFREGVRLSLTHDAHRPLRERRPQDLEPDRLHRLLVWCSVGADVPNGLWSLYGARLAACMTNLTNWHHAATADDRWFARFWRDDVAPRFAGASHATRLGAEVVHLGAVLRAEAALEVADLDAAESRLFKAVHAPVPSPTDLNRLGDMFRRGAGAARDPAAALACYLAAAAGAGDADALHNAARLYREGAGTELDLPRALGLLREARALGSAAASYELGRMHRKGWGVARDSRRALELFAEATARGFRAAHAEMAEMYEAGEGAPADPRRALSHYKRAPERPEFVRRARRLDRALMMAGDPGPRAR